MDFFVWFLSLPFHLMAILRRSIWNDGQLSNFHPAGQMEWKRIQMEKSAGAPQSDGTTALLNALYKYIYKNKYEFKYKYKYKQSYKYKYT